MKHLKGGENIKYDASTTIRMAPMPWHAVAGQKIGSISPMELIPTDSINLKYLERNINRALLLGHPKEAAKFFSLTIKLRTLMIIKKHCT